VLFGEKEQQLNERLKRDMNALIQEQIREMQQMQNDFAGASELMDQKYK
jgi:hypothetical protein